MNEFAVTPKFELSVLEPCVPELLELPDDPEVPGDPCDPDDVSNGLGIGGCEKN